MVTSLARLFAGLLIALTLAQTARAQPSDFFAISIGIRETGSLAPIGADGGTTGGIEWVNLDGQTLVLDGAWHTFTFNFQSDELTAFAGLNANSIYNGFRGTLDHIRIRNTGGVNQPVRLWIDAITNTTEANSFNVSNFEGFGNGAEVTFQEPSFSGSTASNIVGPTSSLTSDAAAFEGTHSNEVRFKFIDGGTDRWLRLITFNTPNLPNPTINFADGSTLTFRMRGVVIPCPQDLNFDAVVNAADLAILLGEWGAPDADLNGDRITNAADLAILLGAWGWCQDD